MKAFVCAVQEEHSDFKNVPAAPFRTNISNKN